MVNEVKRLKGKNIHIRNWCVQICKTINSEVYVIKPQFGGIPDEWHLVCPTRTF